MQMNGMPFGNQIVNPYMNTVPQTNPYIPNYSRPNITPNNGINWVQGIEGAKAFCLPENSNVILLDSESDRFYIKSTDNIGMANLRIFEYSEVTNQPRPTPEIGLDLSEYVRRDELNEILKSLKVGGKPNGKQLISTNDSKPTITE